MTNSLFLGGLLNIVDPVLGLQLYIWCWLGLFVLAGFIHLIFYFGRWKPFKALHGLYYAWKAGSNAAFIFDSNLHGELIDEKTAKCIFDYSKEEYELEIPIIPVIGKFVKYIYTKTFYYPTAYLDNIDPLHAIVYKFGGVNKDVEIARVLEGGDWERSPSVTCGGVDVDIIVDSYSWTIRESKNHKTIERYARHWNENNPTDQIHSYMKFQKYLLTNLIICPELECDLLVPWIRTQTGLPLDLQESDWAGKRRQMAEQDYNADMLLKNKLALWVLGAGVGLALLITTVRLITHFF